MKKEIVEARERLKKASEDTLAALTASRARVQAARAALIDLEGSLLPLVDVQPRIAEVVKNAGEDWVRNYAGRTLLRVTLPPDVMGVRTNYALCEPPRPGGGLVPPLPTDAGIPWGLLCAGDPQRAEKILGMALAKTFAASAYQCGPLLKDREKLLAAAKAELEEAAAEDEALTDEAVAAGLDVKHRPDVTSRRAAEEARKRRDAADVEDRKNRQSKVDGDADNYAGVRLG